MKKISIAFPLILVSMVAFAQEDLSKKLDALNRQIDHAVVAKDIAVLKAGYADDFVFTHGTGLVDSKESWIKTIETMESRYVSREHDSTAVELHGDVAILTGSLSVKRSSKDGAIANYGVRYVRVFALRKKRWQMICHRTVKEWGLH